MMFQKQNVDWSCPLCGKRVEGAIHLNALADVFPGIADCSDCTNTSKDLKQHEEHPATLYRRTSLPE
jgi:hypothetical protein